MSKVNPLFEDETSIYDLCNHLLNVVQRNDLLDVLRYRRLKQEYVLKQEYWNAADLRDREKEIERKYEAGLFNFKYHNILDIESIIINTIRNKKINELINN